MENIEIKDLIKDGTNLSTRIKGLADNRDTRISKDSDNVNIIDEHLIWLIKVNKYFNDYFSYGENKPYGLVTIIKNTFTPSPLEKIYSNIDSCEDLYPNFNDIYNKIIKGVKILEEFALKYKLEDSTGTKTILLINRKNLSISKKDSGFIYYFQKRDGTNKRFNFLMKVVSNPGAYTKSLMEDLGKKNFQTISTEKRNINKLLKKKLGIFDDVITNKDNTGYRINEEKYKIETTK